MPFVSDITKSVPFLKGVLREREQRNTEFVRNLLLNTSHSIEEISSLVGVPVSFVQKIKESI